MHHRQTQDMVVCIDVSLEYGIFSFLDSVVGTLNECVLHEFE